MATIEQWSGLEARALRLAMRLSVRGFAARLGVGERTVPKWEAGGLGLVPSPDSQALLDTAYRLADDEVRERFAAGATKLRAEWVRSGPSGLERLGGFDPAEADEVPGQAATAPRLSAPLVLVPELADGLVRRTSDADQLLCCLAEAVNGPSARVIAIGGPGGFGKSTLALQACHDPRVQRLFSEILWVETGERCTPGRVVQLVSDLCVHLGSTRPAIMDPEQAGFHLARVLAGRRVLIVIDNVWSADDAAPFLIGGPACVRLLTSRNLRVAPPRAQTVRVGPMSTAQITRMLQQSGPRLRPEDTAKVAHGCQGWPLLASVVAASIDQDVAAGARPTNAVAAADGALRALGPQAFDVWDADQRRNAIGQAISSSLSNLEERVEMTGGSSLGERYVSLGVFPPATPIPLAVLSTWWSHAHGWTSSAVRQFARVLADRSLVGAYLADQDAIVLHDIFRTYLRHMLGDASPAAHRDLLDAYRSAAPEGWASLELEHDYMWRHLAFHLEAAGLDDELVDTLAAPAYVLTKAVQFGYQSLAVDQHSLHELSIRHSGGSAHASWQVADALVGRAYLLSGLSSARDVGATLAASVMLRLGASHARQVIGVLGGQNAQAFDIRWTARAVAATESSGHVGTITTAAASHNEIATGGEDGTVRLWRLGSSTPTGTLRGHTGWVYAVAFSPDGRLIASAGDDGFIRLWNVSSAEPVGVLVGHTARIRALTFVGSVGLLASGGEDGEVILWDTDELDAVRHLACPESSIWTIAADAPGSNLAVGGSSGVLRIFDVRTGKQLHAALGHEDWIRSVRYSPAGDQIVSGSGDGTAKVWAVRESGLTLATTLTVGSPVRAVEWTAADRVVTADQTATLRSYSQGRCTNQAKLPAHVDWVRSLAIVDADKVVAGCEDGGVRVWQPEGPTTATLLNAGSGTVWSTAFGGAEHALLGWGNGKVEIRDAQTSEPLRTLQAGEGRVWSLAAGTKVCAAACGDGIVRVWDLVSGDLLYCLNENERRSWAVAVDSDGTALAASTADGMIRVWNLADGSLSWERRAHLGRIRSMAFDARGSRLLTGGGDGSAYLWNAAGGGRVKVLSDGNEWVRAVALNESGTVAALGFGPGNIGVIDVSTGAELSRLTGHRGRILALGVSSSGRHLMSAAADGTVRLWSTESHRQLAEVRLDASLQCASFDIGTRAALVGAAVGVFSLSANVHSLGQEELGKP